MFCSSGGRFNVGGLLEELSGVRPGTECSDGNKPSDIEASQFCPADCSHGCRLPPGVKAESKLKPSPNGPFNLVESQI